MNQSFGIGAFRSRTQVLRMEDALRRAGLNAGVISTPREVAIGCGLSVRFELADTPQVMQIYRRVNPSALIGFYRVDHYGTRADSADAAASVLAGLPFAQCEIIMKQSRFPAKGKAAWIVNLWKRDQYTEPMRGDSHDTGTKVHGHLGRVKPSVPGG